MTYAVTVREIYERNILVEADNMDDAIQKTWDVKDQDVIDIDLDDYSGTEIVPGSYNKDSDKLDDYVEELWNQLENVYFDENENGELILSDNWLTWTAGTSNEEIWHWFDEHHSKGVYWLLYERRK